MRHPATLALAVFAASLVTAADAAEPHYRMVSGHWWEGGSPACNSRIDVEYRGNELTGTLRWREGGQESWHVGAVNDVVPGWGRFFIGSDDESTSVQGTIDGDRIEGSVTFYQRKCDYRFVLQRS